jgi:hypothetical protein
MGRNKIKIESIKNERNRMVTFIKRKKGLFKKAMELALLCDVKVFVAVFSKEQQLSIVSTSDKPHLFIDKYLHKPIQINEFYSIKDYPSLFHSRGCSNINFNNTNTFSDENIYINNDDTSFKVKDDLNTTLDIQMDEYQYKESPFPNTTDANDNITSNLNTIQSQLLNQNNALNSLLNYNLCSLTNYSLLYPLYFNNLSAISPYLYLKLQQYFLALQLKEASSQIENNFLNNKRTRTQINLNSSNNNSLFINNQNEQNEHLYNIESNLSNSQNNFK